MRILRRLVHVLVIVLTLVIGAGAAAIIVSQTAWFKNWLRAYIVREANQYVNGTLSIQRIGGSLFFGIEMENIALSMDGSQVVAVKDLGLDYSVFELISKGLSVNNIRFDQPVIYLRREESSMASDGAVQNYLTKPVLNLRATSDKLSIPEIARLVPALANVKLQPAFEVQLGGPMDRLGVDMNVRSSAGQLTGSLIADAIEPGQSAKGDVTVRGLNLAPILNDPKQKSDITASAKLDVHAESFSKLDSLRGGVYASAPHVAAAGYVAGPLDAKAQFEGRRVALTAHAHAYGASATASGHVVLPDTTRTDAKAQTIPFDLSGQARKLDLRKLPKSAGAPPAATNVNADYHVAGSVT